jgi:hypothetical protein
MKFQEAANVQYRRTTYYTVFLVKGNGEQAERVELGSTQRKTGSGLLSFIRMESVQKILGEQLPNSEIELTKKTANALRLFGGTIRQEASA